MDKPREHPAIVAAHHNVGHEPRIYANGVPKTPAHYRIRIPGMEHNVDHFLKSIYVLLVRNMTPNHRTAVVQRLGDELGIRSPRGYWNQATYRHIFGHWATIFADYVPQHLLVIAQLWAGIIPILFSTDRVPTENHFGFIAVIVFVTRIMVEHGYRRDHAQGLYRTNRCTGSQWLNG